MRLLGIGFVIGVALTVLITTSLDIRSDGGASAAGTWQMKQFFPPIAHSESEPADPERYFTDWIATMPASCSISPAYVFNPSSSDGLPDLKLIHVYYACP